jgi:5-methylcytosine-specific restriction endonuclease McrA
MNTIQDLFDDINKPNVFGGGIDLSKEKKPYVREYDVFLESDYWKQVRKAMFLLHNGKCQYCESTKHLQVHHYTYEHHHDELNHLEDLRLLCNKCHENQFGHGKRYNKRKIFI